MSDTGPADTTPDEGAALAAAFAVLNEIGIIAQLATSRLQAQLPAGFVPAQFNVLNHLSRRPDGATPLQLARSFEVPKTSMTHTLAVLDRHGLVETVANPADGRSKIVRITPAGRGFRDRVIAALGPDLTMIGGRVDPGTFEALLPHLRHLRTVLDAARDPA
jgi:DNA-binding MarR family transcriptional regulator